jgi:MFS family permease
MWSTALCSGLSDQTLDGSRGRPTLQLAVLRFLAGVGLGCGIPLVIALTSDDAPRMAQGHRVVLMSAAVPIGFLLAGLLASELVAAF